MLHALIASCFVNYHLLVLVFNPVEVVIHKVRILMFSWKTSGISQFMVSCSVNGIAASWFIFLYMLFVKHRAIALNSV